MKMVEPKQFTSIEEYLTIAWDLGKKQPEKQPSLEHLNSHILNRLAEDGGLNKAPENIIDHLSSCQHCMQRWGNLRQAVEASRERANIEKYYKVSYGVLKAAASGPATGPLRLTSQCGQYTLSVLPQINDQNRGLITLETTEHNGKSADGHHVTVWDSQNNQIIDGIFNDGKVIQTNNNLSTITLNRNWTVMVNANNE